MTFLGYGRIAWLGTLALGILAGGLPTHAQVSRPSGATAQWALTPQKLQKVAEWQRQARAGDALAQAKMGDFLFSQGDFTNAVRYYYKAARQGVTDAQISLATCYAKGQGVPQNKPLAEKWARLSLVQMSGSPPADPPDAATPASITITDPADLREARLPSRDEGSARQTARRTTEAKDSRHPSGAGNSMPSLDLPEGPLPIAGTSRILILQSPAPRLQDTPLSPVAYSPAGTE